MIITKTPFRISFFGGGTDYPEHFETHGGAVLATAIDKGSCFVATPFPSRMFDYSIRIAYRKVECVKTVEEIQHAPFRECLRLAGIKSDIEVGATADLPSFSGLGTSSSFVVGLLNTLYSFQGKHVRPLELAYRAIELERNILGDKVGCQDQTLAAVGGFNLVEFRRTDDIVVHRLPLKSDRIRDFEQHLLMVYTGIQRRSSDMAAKQIQSVSKNQSRLLRLRQMVDEGFDSLMGSGDFHTFGTLMHEGWLLKSELDSDISNDTIRSMYQAGLDAGAWGGKLLGAGGGGFLLFVVPPEKKGALLERFRNYEEVSVSINAPGSHVIYA